MLFLPLLYYKDNVFKFLNRRIGISATSYSSVWGFFMFFLWGCGPVFIFFTVIRNGEALISNPFRKEVESVDAFYFVNFNGYKGRECIDFIFIYLMYLTGTYGICLSWPYNFLLPAINWVMLCLFISITLNKLAKLELTSEFVPVLVILLVNYFVLILISLIHFEWMNRSNYQLRRKIIYSNDFINNCYTLCHEDLMEPMKLMTESHKEMINSLLRDISKRNVMLTPFLKENIETCNMQCLLLGQLLFLLDICRKKDVRDEDNFFPGFPVFDQKYEGKVLPTIDPESTKERTVIDDDYYVLGCDFIYLKSEIQQLCDIISAYYNRDTFALKIYIDIDSSLSIIRSDKKIIKLLLTNAILNSVSILKQDVHNNNSLSGSWHEIVITIEPRKSSYEHMRFTDWRWLRICVRDTRATETNYGRTSESVISNLVQHKSIEVMELLSKFDKEKTLDSPTFNSFKSAFNIFSIDLPYKFHICHQQILNICNKMKNFKLNVVDNTKLFDRYRQWCKTSSSAKLMFSVLIIQIIPDDQNTLLKHSLQRKGWNVELISSIRVLEFNPNHLNCDCIIVDYSMSPKIVKNTQSQLDEISIIKLFGYNGLIVGVFDNFQENSQKHCKKDLNLAITHPVIDPVIESIAANIKLHELRLLLK